MGNFNCCQEKSNKIKENNRIYQINRIKVKQKEKEKENNNVNITNNNDNNNKNIYEIFSYDIEENNLFKYNIKIPIITSLKGISELNLDSKLYLCGSSLLNEDSSSYLFQISFETVSSKIMVNSKYCHYYPSLIAINFDEIACIGGKKQVQCEIYDTTIDHWSLIAELPEERYKATLCFDYRNKYLYLFGGINSEKKRNKNAFIENDNILRISSKNNSFPIWDKIYIENKIENRLLNRISSAAIFLGENIILIGGENEEGKKIKNISKFDINKLRIELSGKNLEFPAKFINQNVFVEYGFNNLYEKNFFYLFDTENNIHIINKQQYINNLDNDDLQINIISYS